MLEFFAAFIAAVEGTGPRKIVWEKTRQMLASWAVMIAFYWMITFHKDRTYLTVSEKKDFVDDQAHTTNCLLGKIHYLHRFMPWQWRSRFEFGSPEQEPFPHMSIHCPATGSTIIGATANPNAGRSGSWDGAEMDEASLIRYSEDIWGSLEKAVYGPLIMTATPNPHKDIGQEAFSRVRWSGSKSVRVLTTRWDIHPGRMCTCTDPVDLDPAKHQGCWYAKECETLTPMQIAAELNIKYGRPITNRVFYLWDRTKFANKPVPLIPELPIYVTWDPGIGMCAFVGVQVRPLATIEGNVVHQFRFIVHYENSGEAYGHYRDVAEGIFEGRYGKCEVFHVGDPYILDQRDSAKMSWAQNLKREEREHPYQVHIRPAKCVGVSIGNLCENVAKLMKTVTLEDGTKEPLILVDPSLTGLIQHFESYGYPSDREGRITVANPKPLKDEHSHSMDAVQYIVWDRWPMRGSSVPKEGSIIVPEAESIHSELLSASGVGNSWREFENAISRT